MRAGNAHMDPAQLRRSLDDSQEADAWLTAVGFADPEVAQANLARLRQVRDRVAGDLAVTLARVRELASMIHLAKFTGAPATFSAGNP